MQRRRAYAIYVVKSKFGEFLFLLFRTLMIYMEFIQVTKALTVVNTASYTEKRKTFHFCY
jgi:hypothetical protein